MGDGRDRREIFFAWLADRVPSSELLEMQYLEDDVNRLLRAKGKVQKTLYEINDHESVKELLLGLKAEETYYTEYTKLYDYTIRILTYYGSFLAIAIQQHAAQSSESTVSAHPQPLPLVVDFAIDRSYANARPISVSYFNETIKCRTWRSVYMYLVKKLFEDYPQRLVHLADKALIPNESNDFSHDFTNIFGSTKLSNDFYFDSNRTADGVIKRIPLLLNECNIDLENIVIEYSELEPPRKTLSSIALPNQDVVTETAADNPVSTFAEEDELISLIKDLSIPYINNRHKNGALWLIGGLEIRPQIDELRKAGYFFAFAKSGGKTTNGKPAYYMINYPARKKKTSTQNSPVPRTTSVHVPGMPRKLDEELQTLLAGEDLAQLRAELSRQSITTFEQFRAINLWQLMNQAGLYRISQRMDICRRVRTLLENADAATEEPGLSHIIKTTYNAYTGATPSKALLAYCQALAVRFPLSFRLLVGMFCAPVGKVLLMLEAESPDALQLSNPTAYLCENFSKEDAFKAAHWLWAHCKDDDEPCTIEEPPEVQSSQSEPAVPPPLEPEQPHIEPQYKTRAAIMACKVKEALIHASMEGLTIHELKYQTHVFNGIEAIIAADLNVVQLGDRYYYDESFTDFEEGANQLEAILDKLFAQNSGYASATQLYQYAQSDMDMFLNLKGLAGQQAVYDLAKYLFTKACWHGKHFSFSSDMHINQQVSGAVRTNSDLVEKYASEHDGYFTYQELESYLHKTGMSTTNLRNLLHSKGGYLCYDEEQVLQAEAMHMDADWYKEADDALAQLFDSVGDHIVLRDVPQIWLDRLPTLPCSLPWTRLLLQQVLLHHREKLKAHTIPALSGQSRFTLHAMLVRDDSPIETFNDVVLTYLQEEQPKQRTFEAEALRKLLVKRGIITGNELIYNMPKALRTDIHVSWDNSNWNVTIRI